MIDIALSKELAIAAGDAGITGALLADDLAADRVPAVGRPRMM
jgi:hypothetical protein